MSEKTETLDDADRVKHLEEKISAGEPISSDEMVSLLTRIHEIIIETTEEGGEPPAPVVSDVTSTDLDDRALWETEQSAIEAFSSGAGKVYLSQSA